MKDKRKKIRPGKEKTIGKMRRKKKRKREMIIKKKDKEVMRGMLQIVIEEIEIEKEEIEEMKEIIEIPDVVLLILIKLMIGIIKVKLNPILNVKISEVVVEVAEEVQIPDVVEDVGVVDVKMMVLESE